MEMLKNIAENLARLGTDVTLISALGAGHSAQTLRESLAGAGLHEVDSGHDTGSYTAVLNDNGGLVIGVADMAATDAITPDLLKPEWFGGASVVVLDGNLPIDTLARAIQIHTDQPEAHIELHEDLLLAVDVMLALKQPNEAVIIASDAYNQALTGFGPDTLPHAEALLVVGSATLASGDREAARTLVGDARQILERLQTERSDTRLPISSRALQRCDELSAALAGTPTSV